MSLATNVTDLATRVATEAKALRTLINGNATDLTALTTTAKASLVAAINELDAAIGAAGAQINDGVTDASTVWSSSKTNTQISAATAALVAAAPGTLDTLNEIAAALGDDPNFATTITAALGNRVRVDAVQSLTGAQQIQARANIGAGTGSSNLAIGTTAGTAADAGALVTSLAGKAPTVHGHALTDANMTGVLPAAQLPSATEAAKGAVELATTAEATTGTDTTRAVTPAGLKIVADTKAAASHTHTAAQISDATTTGRSVLTAASAAAARTAIGAGTGSSNLAIGTTAGTAADAAAVGDTNANFVTTFEAGLV